MTEQTPKISVILPAYKGSVKLLKRAIDSILNQTFSDFELIIVLDNPENNNLIDFFREYEVKDKRVRLFVNEHNLGIAGTVNRGIKAALGEFIARQDDDDFSFSDRLEKQIAFFELNPSADVVGTGLDYCTEEGTSLLKRFYAEKVDSEIRKANPLAHPTVMFRKSSVEKFGYYNETTDVKNVEDYELWIRWYLQGARFFNLQEILYSYTQSKSNIKNRNTKHQLLQTVKLKWRHRKGIKFGISDYLYLFSETCVSLLPSKIIASLFYKIMKMK